MSERDLTVVLGDMLELIPDGQTRLRAQLASVRSSAHYTPPECMGIAWRKAQIVLIDNIGEPDPGWQTDVARCFQGPG